MTAFHRAPVRQQKHNRKLVLEGTRVANCPGAGRPRTTKPAFLVCLVSLHILTRSSDPEAKMQIPAGVSRQGSAEKSTDGEQSPGGPSRTCAVIKNNHLHPRKFILWARNIHPLVSSDTPS
jgi:hypothetical protein